MRVLLVKVFACESQHEPISGHDNMSSRFFRYLYLAHSALRLILTSVPCNTVGVSSEAAIRMCHWHEPLVRGFADMAVKYNREPSHTWLVDMNESPPKRCPPHSPGPIPKIIHAHVSSCPPLAVGS